MKELFVACDNWGLQRLPMLKKKAEARRFQPFKTFEELSEANACDFSTDSEGFAMRTSRIAAPAV